MVQLIKKNLKLDLKNIQIYVISLNNFNPICFKYLLARLILMADRVDNIMEHMLEEFNFYQIEELFSKGEIKNIVKSRRSQEYQMHRKDADASYFLDAIHYEKKLQRTKVNRK